MPTTEYELRAALHWYPAAGFVDTEAILSRACRTLRRRRWRRGGGVLAVSVVFGTALFLDARDDAGHGYQLAGSGLTLADDSSGPVQVAADRVDLGDGIQAWRRGELLYIGYPSRPYAELDTSSLTSQWDDLGHDAVVFDDMGQQDGSTIVVGTVRGSPTSVTVTVGGVSQPATIACFKQATGWCSYKADVPTSIQNSDAVDIEVR